MGFRVNNFPVKAGEMGGGRVEDRGGGGGGEVEKALAGLGLRGLAV